MTDNLYIVSIWANTFHSVFRAAAMGMAVVMMVLFAIGLKDKKTEQAPAPAE